MREAGRAGRVSGTSLASSREKATTHAATAAANRARQCSDSEDRRVTEFLLSPAAAGHWFSLIDFFQRTALDAPGGRILAHQRGSRALGTGFLSGVGG